MVTESILMVARWRGSGGMGEEARALRSASRYLHNSHGDIKYSIGNGVAKELISMTHGHDQWCGVCLREWGVLVEGLQREKIGTTVIA